MLVELDRFGGRDQEGQAVVAERRAKGVVSRQDIEERDAQGIDSKWAAQAKRYRFVERERRFVTQARGSPDFALRFGGGATRLDGGGEWIEGVFCHRIVCGCWDVAGERRPRNPGQLGGRLGFFEQAVCRAAVTWLTAGRFIADPATPACFTAAVLGM